MGIDIRVIYGDTDQMGIVYYANYLRYFEAARGAYLRERGRSYSEIEALGVALPVVEAHAQYRAPARYDELIRVQATVTEVRAASLRFAYRVTRDAKLLVEGMTVHACVDKGGRPVRFPDAVLTLLGEGREHG